MNNSVDEGLILWSGGLTEVNHISIEGEGEFAAHDAALGVEPSVTESHACEVLWSLYQFFTIELLHVLVGENPVEDFFDMLALSYLVYEGVNISFGRIFLHLAL